jgi:hypothetical protein
MLYALGESAEDPPADGAYGEGLPTATDPGAYHVWYRVRGDVIHLDSEPACVTARITGLGFRSHSLLLDGRIGVKFYMDLSALTDEERAGSSVTFRVSGRGGFTATDPFDAADTNPSGSYYGFTCYVSSIQMADRITATFSCEGRDDISDEYSVADYVAFAEGNADAFEAAGEEGAATLALVRALADYGHYVQPFLSKARGWAIGSDYAEMGAASALGDADVGAARAATEGAGIRWTLPEGCGVAKATYSLGLNAGTDIFLYFRMEGGARVESATLDGAPARVELCSDGRYRVTVPNISAHELGRRRVVVVGTSTGAQASAEVSALSYVRGLLASDAYKDDADALLAVTSLYRYWAAADRYLKAIGEGGE